MLGAPHAESVAVLIWCTSGILPYLSAPVSFKRLLDGGPSPPRGPSPDARAGAMRLGRKGFGAAPRVPTKPLIHEPAAPGRISPAHDTLEVRGSARRLTDRA